MAAPGGPPDSITRARRKCTQKLKVIFAMFQLIEADVSFNGDTRPRVTKVGIAAGDDGKALAFGLPGKIGDGICRKLRYGTEV